MEQGKIKWIIAAFLEKPAYLHIISLCLALGTGLFANGYWLVEYFSVDSKRLQLTTSAIVVTSYFTYLFLTFYSIETLKSWSIPKRFFVVGIGVLLGSVFLFAGTSQWERKNLYLTPFLPTNTLQIMMDDQPQAKIAVDWVTISLGEISFKSFHGTGWNIQDSKIVLEAGENHNLSWSGKTGEMMQLVLYAEAPTNVSVSWNGQPQEITIASGTSTLRNEFSIPFFASRTFVLLLGLLFFFALSLPGVIFFLSNQNVMDQIIQTRLIAPVGRLQKSDGIFILLVLIVAFLLRIYDLDRLYPSTDEYNHLVAARKLLDGANFQEVYQRSLWMVTYPVAIMFEQWGANLWNARLISVVVNVMAIVPLYVIANRINRTVGYLAIILYATSPWIIVFSRLVREYAYYPFFYYLIIFGLIKLLEMHGTKEPFRFNKISYPYKNIGLLVLLSIPILYMAIDVFSTFKLISIAYLAAILILMTRWGGNNRVAVLFLGLLVGLIFVIILPMVLRFEPAITLAPLKFFFSDPPQQWYHDKPGFIPLVSLLLAIAIGYVVRKRSITVYYLSLLLFSYVLAFSLLDNPARPLLHARFLLIAQLWFIPLMAFGLYVFVIYLQKIARKYNQIPLKTQRFFVNALPLAVVFLFWNPAQTIFPVVAPVPDLYVLGPADFYFHDVGPAQTYIEDNFEKGDILISEVFFMYNSWVKTPTFDAKYYLPSRSDPKKLMEIIAAHSSGWIVIGEVEMISLTYPIFDVLAGNPKVQYAGLFGDQHLWRWNFAGDQVPGVCYGTSK